MEGEITDLTEEDVSLSEGDLVRLEGVVYTDAIYRVLTLINAYSELMEVDNKEQIQQAHELLYSDNVGVSVEVEDSSFSFGMRFDPSKLWIDQTHAFLGNKNHVILGRVSETIGGDETWDYLHIAELIDSVLADETMAELRDVASQIIDAIGSAEEDMELPDISSVNVEAFGDFERMGEATKQSPFRLDIEDKEIAIDGPGFVVYPIAIYW
jgi:hypothetical protein